MTEQTRDLITWTLGTVIALSAILGIVVRVILLPYLREHLVEPMGVVKEQVKNSHDANLRDDLDSTRDDINALRADVRSVSEQIKVQSAMFEGHITWAERLVKVIEREIDDIRGARLMSQRLCPTLPRGDVRRARPLGVRLQRRSRLSCVHPDGGCLSADGLSPLSARAPVARLRLV
jgi:hypothetical protein